MNAYSILLYCFMFSAALSTLGLLFSKNVFKAALLLLVCLLSIAALYVLMFAEFIAVTQILIYAGGVMILIIFGVMLTSKISGKPLRTEHSHIFYGTITGIIVLTALCWLIHSFVTIDKASHSNSSIRIIGIDLMTNFALPFEVAGIILLVALIGAAVTTSILKSKKA